MTRGFALNKVRASRKAGEYWSNKNAARITCGVNEKALLNLTLTYLSSLPILLGLRLLATLEDIALLLWA